MRLFVDFWSDPLIINRIPTWLQKEQDALTYLIVRHPHLRERTAFVPQRSINAYVEGASMWGLGDLLVHFAGCWYSTLWQLVTHFRVESRCPQNFNEFWGMRQNGRNIS